MSKQLIGRVDVQLGKGWGEPDRPEITVYRNDKPEQSHSQAYWENVFSIAKVTNVVNNDSKWVVQGVVMPSNNALTIARLIVIAHQVRKAFDENKVQVGFSQMFFGNPDDDDSWGLVLPN